MPAACRNGPPNHNMAPIMFAALVAPPARLPGGVRARRQRPVLRAHRHRAGLFPTAFLQALPERVFGVMSNDTLLAIPFFTFMGLILERSGMAEDLLDTIGPALRAGPRRPRLRGRSSSARCSPPPPAWWPPR